MTFKEEIAELIDSNLKTYRDNPDRFLSDYNRELELTKEYNGRQLLELLQNADDAGSKEVEISWNKNTSQLTISNKGEAFSVGGIKSLMLANLSTKTKVIYIGNKGLGFRSILNWATLINIYSKGSKLSFSNVIAKDVYDNQLNLSSSDKKKIRENRNLTKEAIPFPTLAIPTFEDNKIKTTWTTTIEIFCRGEFEVDIENQLSEITEEILLFLNNIQKITIHIADNESKELVSNKKKNIGYEIIKIKDKSWKVFSRDKTLPKEYQDKSKNEKQSFNLKVAFRDDLSDNYKKLFNYFPTQLSISLPCIIHGTFELNSSRNHLNESKKNEFILKELVELFKSCAEFLTTEKLDWRAFKLLTPTQTTSDSKLIEVFYADLKTAKDEAIIYPCVINQYKPLSEAVYYSDEFNSFFQVNFPTTLPGLILPLGEELKGNFTDDKFKHEYLVEQIDELSNTELQITIRAELITQLSKVVSNNSDDLRFSLLVNEAGKVISKDDIAFTPVVRSDEKFRIPKSVKVDFMKSELFDLLITNFESSFEKNEPKPRELQRKIKSVVNLQPYDSNNVIDKIITGTKDALKSIRNTKEKLVCINEMITALYANFKHIENRQERLKITVPLISKAKQVTDAENLFLSKTYPSGLITEAIYRNTIMAEEYLAPINFWNLQNEEPSQVESFFIWLGVNRYSKLETIHLNSNWKEKKYLDFIFANDAEYSDDFRMDRIQRDSLVTSLVNIEQIKSLPIERILLLTLKDVLIRKNLEHNDERIGWQYNYGRTLFTQYSYIRFQFITSNIFTNFLIEEGGEELNKLINDNFEIDYDFLFQFGINKTEVKSILIKLGAKESFNEISPENIYQIINSIPDRDLTKKGKATQSIYKMALESLVKQESDFPVPDDLIFFSKKGVIEEYSESSKIYYTDNNILPRKILDTLNILNLPKRIGEDNVERYFGVKSLREFKIEIEQGNIKYNPCDAELNRIFEQIKPYILAYRLNAPNLRKKINDTDTKKKEAKTLKQCRIHIVSECYFKFGDSENILVEEKEFINVKDDFYFTDRNSNSLNELKKDSIFCDAFAEMMCIVFKVNDLKNDFRQIFKNDFQDTHHLATQDFGKKKIEEAFQFLGISRIEIDFWKTVFALKGKKFQEPIENTEKLKLNVQKSLGLTLADDYQLIDFENFKNKTSFELIKNIAKKLSLPVNKILPQGLFYWHYDRFNEAIKDLENKFKYSLWTKLNANQAEQSEFISTLGKYNLEFISLIESKIRAMKFELNIEYTKEVKTLIKKHFQISFDDSIADNAAIKNYYTDLLKSYNIEETDISELSIRSILFFEGNKDLVEKYLKTNFATNTDNDSNENSNDAATTGNIIDASLTRNGKQIPIDDGSTRNGNWVHSGQSEQGKKRKGKNAEALVYNSLVKQYGVNNVKWVSGNSTTPDKNDKLHYDIEYKNKEGEWKFLEVKAISDDYFIISNSEKEKGLSEPDKYEMALVQDENIYIIKDLFEFAKGESFENNNKFTARPKDYIFQFKITEQAE